MGSPVAPTYLAGYLGTVEVDSVALPVQGWKSSADPGLWDATNSATGGWSKQERGVKKITFTFTVVCKATNGVPAFKEGDIYPAEFTINGTIAYSGNVIISKLDTDVQNKGGVMFNITADSDGPMTGLAALS